MLSTKCAITNPIYIKDLALNNQKRLYAIKPNQPTFLSLHYKNIELHFVTN